MVAVFDGSSLHKPAPVVASNVQPCIGAAVTVVCSWAARNKAAQRDRNSVILMSNLPSAGNNGYLAALAVIRTAADLNEAPFDHGSSGLGVCRQYVCRHRYVMLMRVFLVGYRELKYLGELAGDVVAGRRIFAGYVDAPLPPSGSVPVSPTAIIVSSCHQLAYSVAGG